LRWDDPLHPLDVLGSLGSSTGLPSVTSAAAQAVTVRCTALQGSALLSERRMDLPLRHLEDAISQCSQGALSFAWPSLLRSSV
jgi:hypothetical protein